MNRVAANLAASRSSSSGEIRLEHDGRQSFIDDVGGVTSFERYFDRIAARFTGTRGFRCISGAR